jgi:hypothetical protein
LADPPPTARTDPQEVMVTSSPAVPAVPAVPARLRPSKAAELSGRVVDVRGKPVAGASVTVVGLAAGDDELAVVPYALPLAADAARGSLPRPIMVGTTIADGHGVFVLSDLPAGRCRVEITYPDMLPLHRAPVSLVEGHRRLLGDLTLATE